MALSREDYERLAKQMASKYGSVVSAPSIAMSQAGLPDSVVGKMPNVFPGWKPGVQLEKDQIVVYDGEKYRVGQDVISSNVYKPGDEGTTALYSKINIDESGYEVWQRWDGVSGSYQQGKVVKDPNDGKLYKSKIPNNVWGPPSQQPTYWESYEE